mmetsp:Transcript_42912/g.63029  ORF Transcript_42912/g.63029 Transcript_42912/m.63029 type:complete len:82 (+) Transcript_42912:816-1061(+)
MISIYINTSSSDWLTQPDITIGLPCSLSQHPPLIIFSSSSKFHFFCDSIKLCFRCLHKDTTKPHASFFGVDIPCFQKPLNN